MKYSKKLQHKSFGGDHIAPSVYPTGSGIIKNAAAGAEWVQGTPRRDVRCIRRGVL